MIGTPWRSATGLAHGVAASILAVAMSAVAGPAAPSPSTTPTSPTTPTSTTTLTPRPPSDAAMAAVRTMQRRHFGRMKLPERRAAGRDAIAAETDPDRLMAMAVLLRAEADDVRRSLLDRLASPAGDGQPLLAWIAIVDEDPRLRGAATMRLTEPAGPGVRAMLRAALVHGTLEQQDRAAELAAWIGVTELLPMLVDRLVRCRPSGVSGTSDDRGLGLGVALVLVSGGSGTPGTIGGPAHRVSLRSREASWAAGCAEFRCAPRPAMHAAVLALARRIGGSDTPDFGIDRSRWRAWIEATDRPRSP